MKIVFSPSISQRGVDAIFAEALDERDGLELISTDDDSYKASLGDAEVLVVTGRETFDAALAPRLRHVFVHGAGFDQLPVDAFRDNGVTITPTVGASGVAMAEHAMLSILAMAKRLPDIVQAQAGRTWEPPAGHPRAHPDLPYWQQTREIAGSILGIVGFGQSGRLSAQHARAFGMKVIAFRRTASEDPDADEVYALKDFKKQATQCDYILLTIAATPETRHFMDRDSIQAMKPGACLINIARGALVNEPDLIDALRAGHLGGAALDVFESEPLPQDNPLWDLPNVLITPHCAGYTPHMSERSARQFAKLIRAVNV